jgi:hypothetical protein
MRKRDIIVGTVIIVALIVVTVLVGISVYRHEIAGTAM